MTTYYKATRPDGTDFYTGLVAYAVGETVTHPNPHTRDASGYLSVATVATDCTGMRWPCRLFEVSADTSWPDDTYPNKRCTHSLTVLRELEPHLVLGPQGVQVAALIQRCHVLSPEETRELAAARDAARVATRATRDAAWDAAWDATRNGAWDATRDAWDAAWDAARDAARALIVRDLIGDKFTQAHYDTLSRPWRTAIGPLHPDDTDLPVTP